MSARPDALSASCSCVSCSSIVVLVNIDHSTIQPLPSTTRMTIYSLYIFDRYAPPPPLPPLTSDTATASTTTTGTAHAPSDRAPTTGRACTACLWLLVRRGYASRSSRRLLARRAGQARRAALGSDIQAHPRQRRRDSATRRTLWPLRSRANSSRLSRSGTPGCRSMRRPSLSTALFSH